MRFTVLLLMCQVGLRQVSSDISAPLSTSSCYICYQWLICQATFSLHCDCHSFRRELKGKHSWFNFPKDMERLWPGVCYWYPYYSNLPLLRVYPIMHWLNTASYFSSFKVSIPVSQQTMHATALFLLRKPLASPMAFTPS